MSSIDLAGQLGSIIQAVPGVRIIYPAAPILDTVVSEVVAAATATHSTSSPIVIHHSADNVTATIHIGVNAVSPAPDVALAASQAARDFLRSTGATECIVDLRIGSIG